MASGSLLAEVAAGIPGAGSGTAYFYVPGTTVLKVVYADSALSVIGDNPKTLDSNGAAIVYTIGPTRVVPFTSAGVALSPYELAGTETAAEVSVDSSYWTDTDVDAVLERIGVSVGGTDGKLLQVVDQTALTLKSVFNGIAYSVKTWGAAGDGTTDDTVAIQNALDYVAGLTYKGTVYFPPGNYKLSASLSLTSKSGFVIRGAGVGQVTLTQSSTSVGVYGIALTSCSDFEISGIKLTQTTRSTVSVGIELNTCTRFHVFRCDTTGTASGADGFDYGLHTTVTTGPCVVLGCRLQGYTLGAYSEGASTGRLSYVACQMTALQNGNVACGAGSTGTAHAVRYVACDFVTNDTSAYAFQLAAGFTGTASIADCSVTGTVKLDIAATNCYWFERGTVWNNTTVTPEITDANTGGVSRWECTHHFGLAASAQLTATGNFTPNLMNGRHFLFDAAPSAGAQTMTIANPTNGHIAKERGDIGFFVQIKVTTANTPAFAFGSEYAVGNLAPAISTTNAKTTLLHIIWDGAKWRIAGNSVMDT